MWTDVHDLSSSFLTKEDFMSFFTALVTSKVAAGVLAGGTLAVGGTAAGAYTGTLPAPLQQSAHEIIGAPAAAHPSQTADHPAGADSHGKDARPSDAPSPNPSATPAGPDATGPAAFGLCKAFAKGGLDSTSTAYKSLSAAAGGAGIAEYCKTVAAPGESAEHGPETPGNSGKSEDEKIKAHPPAQAERGLSHKPATAGKP
jgi:hypothetical protein